MPDDISYLPEPSHDDQLDAVLADYLRRTELGEYVDRTALLAEHPQLAEELKEFFANQTRFSRVMSAPPAPPSATRLRYFGDYELLEEIAHGGMGVVYKARQTSLSRTVAVKMILAGQLANDGEVKRFQAEAEAAANLHHPGVVAIYEVGIHAGQHYFSMEYIEGPNLAQLMRDQPVPAGRAAELLREMAEVVEFAHSQGVLHRDLKPSNILIDPRGRVRITDFGLAKRVAGNSDLTITGQVIGTPSYMSPEQSLAQHHKVGPASDIYALGAIFYELVTGRPPFRSETPTETMRQVQQDEPVRPRLLNPKLPRDLETICLKCLEKAAQQRYGSAKDLADELGRFLRGEPILARPLGPLSRAGRWCRRHALAVGSSVTIACLLLAIAVGLKFGLDAWQATRRLADDLRITKARELADGGPEELAEALALISVVVAHRPEAGQLYLQRALLHYNAGDSAAALTDCRAAQQRGEQTPESQLLLAAAALETGDRQGARSAAAKLMEQAPSGVESILAQILTSVPNCDSLERLNAAFAGQSDNSRLADYRALATLHILQHQGSKPAYDQATALLAQSLRRRPHDQRARQALCLCWIGFHFLADPADRPLDKARETLDAWSDEQPDDWRPLALKARLHLEREEYVKAELLAKQGRGRFGRRPEFAHVLALSLREQQKHQAAELAFGMAGNLRVAERNTLWPLSQLQLAAEQALNARPPIAADWSTTLAAHIVDGDPAARTYHEWHAVARALSATRGKKDGAPTDIAAWCAQWRAIAPECPAAYDIHVPNIDTGASYEQAIKLGPSLRAARLGRAAQHEREKRYREARQEYEAYLQLSPDDVRGLLPLASLYAECPDRAQRDLAQARKLAAQATTGFQTPSPQNSSAWQLLARIEWYAGHHAAALAALQRAAEIEPENLEIRWEQSRVLLDQGAADQARRQIDEVLLSRQPNYRELYEAANVLSYSPHADAACGRRALELVDEAIQLMPKQLTAAKKRLEKQLRRQLHSTAAMAHYRAGDWGAAAAELPLAGDQPYEIVLDPFFRALILWQAGKPDEARAAYDEAATKAGDDLVHFDWRQRPRAALRAEAAHLLGYQFDEVAAAQDIATHDVRPGDYTQLGRWGARNNVVEGRVLPETWAPGEFDRNTGVWDATKAHNVKWVAQLGSQSYGNPVVANGRILVGTNNGAAHLKRFPEILDKGVLVCFREADGELLWQYTCDKLPTGRVHDWPLMGICSSPLVEGDRAWLVSNQGKVLCLDMLGFHDDRDDGIPRNDTYKLFTTEASRLNGLDDRSVGPALYQDLVRMQGAITAPPEKFRGAAPSPSMSATVLEKGRRWKVQWSRYLGQVLGQVPGGTYYTLELSGDHLLCQVHSVADDAPIGEVVRIPTEIYPPPVAAEAVQRLKAQFSRYGVELPEQFEVETLAGGQWTFQLEPGGRKRRYTLTRDKHVLTCVEQLVDFDPQEADVLWEYDMMKELKISQHNMCTCPPTCWEDTLFICTSNGVNDNHTRVPAAEAPSFIAMDKHTGQVLWTDNSPGANIHHGQWSGPAVGVLGGVPQVIFPGGDGWVYSFHAEQYADGKPELLWKFDVNLKDVELSLGGRGTRNEVIALPVIYDGRVYVSTGQDPEHGEGTGELWCLDPTKRGDISRQLVVDRNDRNRVIPHRRLKAILPEQEEILIENPNSGVVWNYNRLDHDGDREEDFEDAYHRSLSSVAIKNDLLIAADFSGLVHCLNAKTGQFYWQHDMLGAIWASPLIVGDRVLMADEDGDVTVFPLTPYARKGNDPVTVETQAEINMLNSIYTTPIVAGDVLYLCNKSYLFAIGRPESGPLSSEQAE